MKKTEYSPQSGNKANKKRACLIAVNFLVMFVVYQLCIKIGERINSPVLYEICTVVYGVALVALLTAYFIITRSSAKTEADAPNVSAKAKLILCFVFPLITVLLIDILDLFVVEYFKQLLSVL